MEAEAGGFADLREASVFAKEAIAGVDGVGVGDFGGADDGGNVEIAATTPSGADTDGLVGETHMEAVAVGLGVDGHRLDAEFFAGADNAEGDFSPVGDEDLTKHNLRF